MKGLNFLKLGFIESDQSTSGMNEHFCPWNGKKNENAVSTKHFICIICVFRRLEMMIFKMNESCVNTFSLGVDLLDPRGTPLCFSSSVSCSCHPNQREYVNFAVYSISEGHRGFWVQVQPPAPLPHAPFPFNSNGSWPAARVAATCLPYHNLKMMLGSYGKVSVILSYASNRNRQLWIWSMAIPATAID